MSYELESRVIYGELSLSEDESDEVTLLFLSTHGWFSFFCLRTSTGRVCRARSAGAAADGRVAIGVGDQGISSSSDSTSSAAA